MAISKSQQKAVHKYVKANYDRMELTVPKGQKDTIKAHAASLGESVNGFVSRVIMETMERGGSGTPPAAPQDAAGRPAGAGVVSLPPETLDIAQRAAEAAGEALPMFIIRAVSETAERDKATKELAEE